MKAKKFPSTLCSLLLIVFLTSCSNMPENNRETFSRIKDGENQVENDMVFHRVTYVSNKNNVAMNTQNNRSSNSNELQIRQGSFFSYALPSGWKVAEEGQYAISLVAPDNKAVTVMVGNAGYMSGYPAAQFIYEKMMALRPEALQLGQPARAQAINGFQEAYTFPVSYRVNGEPCQGEATCHINNYYGGCVMVMTAALSAASQWSSYSKWLPQVAMQMSATNGAAFGIRGLMQQNLKNSMAYSEAAKSYREWSQNNWQQVTDERNRSVDNQNYQFRENLGAVNTYHNPHNISSPVELSTQYKYYWMNDGGEIVGTNEEGVNPNHGSTENWKPMQRKEQKY